MGGDPTEDAHRRRVWHAIGMVAFVLVASLFPFQTAATDNAVFIGTTYINEHFQMEIGPL